MSNALALAAVSAVLKDLLDNGLIDNNLRAAFVNDVAVSAVAPDLVKAGATDPARLNLFLYRVTPNPGWRNAELPSRDRDGNRVSSPPLALDLHYLLTAYASNDFEAELLLGYAMQQLHETPGLSAAAVRAALAPNSPVGTGLLPPALQALRAADLADQPEALTIAPENLSMEELSRLWSATQARYRPSAAYVVTTVLLGAPRSARRAPQVRRVNARALGLAQPVIERVLVGDPPAERPVTWGARLTLVGRNLGRGGTAKVLVGDALATPAPGDIADDRVALALAVPPLPAPLRAGVQTVQVVHELALVPATDPHRGAESPAVAFFLRPRVVAAAVSNAQGDVGGTRRATVTVTADPPVGAAQRAVLLLTGLSGARPPAFSFTAPARAADGAAVNFEVRRVPAGDYLVRVQIDGAESMPDVETNPASANFNQYTGTPRVTL